MLLSVCSSALMAVMANWIAASTTTVPKTVITGDRYEPHSSGIVSTARSGRWCLFMSMAWTTALMSSLAVYACAAGINPVTTVTTASTLVRNLLAPHTSAKTRGMPASVPLVDVASERRRPRRLLSVSSLGSREGRAPRAPRRGGMGPYH